MQPNTSPQQRKFRKDVNGLRAIAVLAVLLFHLFSYLKTSLPSLDVFNGGYIGVDIFFVISGFLMTAIIVRGLHAGTFSVWNFWKRRASRICPALMVLVIVVLLVGFFIQLPYVFRETCREAFRGMLFISNFWLARDQGYFAESVVNETLLHTWSLSVEWQFYLLYPLLLLAWGKLCSLRTIPHFIGAMLAVSLATSFILTSDKSYFMLHTRAWELLLGGIIFTLPPLNLKAGLTRLLECSALVVVVLNIALAEPMRGWDVLQVLPGVLASALILWLNVEHSLLSNALMQYTGKISYSLYLIHWPVIVVCSKLGLLHYFLPILGGIVIYAALSYHFIETKRRWHWSIVLIYALVIALAIVGNKNKGVTPFNSSLIDTKSYHEVYYGGKDIPEKGIVYHGIKQGEPALMIMGDSYARQYANFFNQEIPFIAVFSDGQMQFKGVYVFPIFKKLPLDEYKVYFDNYRYTLSHSSVDTVVIAQNWGLYLKQIEGKVMSDAFTVEPFDLSARRDAVAAGIIDLVDTYSDKEFYIIGQPVADPRFGEDCVMLKNSNHAFIRSIFGWLDCPRFATTDFSLPNEINDFLMRICEQRDNLHFINPSNAICDNSDNTCRVITDDYKLIFSDGTHLSLSGAEIVGDYILQQLKVAPRSELKSGQE